jgi:hypothetical protein
MLLRRRCGRNTRYFLPLGIDCGREFIHLLKEHRDFPVLLVFQRGSEARHSGEADSVLHRPERCRLGIVFDPILGELRCFDIKTLGQFRWLGVRCAVAYRAIVGVQVHARDQILVARLNGIAERLGVALDRSVHRGIRDPTFQGGGLTIRVRRYDACFDSEVPDAGQHGQCEDDTEEETCDRSHLHSFSAQTRFWFGDQFGSGEARNPTGHGLPGIHRRGRRYEAVGHL